MCLVNVKRSSKQKSSCRNYRKVVRGSKKPLAWLLVVQKGANVLWTTTCGSQDSSNFIERSSKKRMAGLWEQRQDANARKIQQRWSSSPEFLQIWLKKSFQRNQKSFSAWQGNHAQNETPKTHQFIETNEIFIQHYDCYFSIYLFCRHTHKKK